MGQERKKEIIIQAHKPSKLEKALGIIMMAIGFIGIIAFVILLCQSMMSYPYEIQAPLFLVLLLICPSLFFIFLGRYFLTKKKTALALSSISIFILIVGLIIILLPEKTIKEGKKNCVTKEDCVIFTKSSCPQCGCYNKNNKPIIIGGWVNVSLCLCLAPSGCECINGQCEGAGNETIY